MSNRSLLANALEAAIIDETQLKRLAEYRQNIAEADAQEQKLRQLNAEIKELSFAKGERDTERLRQLKDEAVKTRNRLDIYDKRLLRLDAAAPLQAVLKREREKAYTKARTQNEQAMAALRDKAEVRQSELLREYRETKAALRNQQSDTATMEKEFVRIVKEYDKLAAKTDAKAGKDRQTIKKPEPAKCGSGFRLLYFGWLRIKAPGCECGH